MFYQLSKNQCVMKFFQIIKNNIPNTITCLNLVSGCLAIMFAFNYDKCYGALHGYEMVYICIAAAAVFDFFDGMMARLLHAYSSLGKELDSLSDLVSFGVAPGMLMWNSILLNTCEGIFSPWIVASLAIPVFAALRLAKFNIDDSQTTSFIGLPVPANALFWIGVCAWMHANSTFFTPWIMAIVMVLFSSLMVSRLHMFSLKFKNLAFADNFVRYVLIVGAVIFIVSYQAAGLAWTIITYILLSIVTRNKTI